MQNPKWDIIRRVASSNDRNFRRILGIEYGKIITKKNVKKASNKTMLAVHPDRFRNKRSDDLQKKVLQAREVLIENPLINTRGFPVIVLPANFNVIQPVEKSVNVRKGGVANVEAARERARRQLKKEKRPSPPPSPPPPPPTQSYSFPNRKSPSPPRPPPTQSYSFPKSRSPSPPRTKSYAFSKKAANMARKAFLTGSESVRTYGPVFASKVRNVGKAAFQVGTMAAKKGKNVATKMYQLGQNYGPVAARKTRNVGKAVFQVGTMAAKKGKNVATKMYQLGQNYGPKLVSELVKISHSGKNKANKLTKLFQKYGENRVVPALKEVSKITKQKYRNVSGRTALNKAMTKKRNAETKYKSTQRNYMNLQQKIQNMTRELSSLTRGSYKSNYMLPAVLSAQKEFNNLLTKRNKMQKNLQNNASRVKNANKNVEMLKLQILI